MRSAYRLLAAAILACLHLLVSSPATAQAADDTLVQAWNIGQIASLDPAEASAPPALEIVGNSYERLIGFDPKDASKLVGVVADSWDISADGKTLTFRVRKGLSFASGNPVSAEDAVFSLQRAVMLEKSRVSILNQLGLKKDNVGNRVRQTGEYTFDVELDQAFAPSLVLSSFTTPVASIVDKALLLQNEKDADLGHGWLRTNFAGSGPFSILAWDAEKEIVLERNDRYWGDAPKIKRIVYRHVPDASDQRLLLEGGEVDIARTLDPDGVKALRTNPDIQVQSGLKGAIYYLGLNQKNPNLARPQVRRALKFLVDYEGLANTVLGGGVVVHQSFLPRGFLGALEETPYSLNVAQAKALLKEAGLEDGFELNMYVADSAEIGAIAQSIQQTFSEAGVAVELDPLVIREVRERTMVRKHDLYIGRWVPDFQDPHAGAAAFARNLDNADNAPSKPLAWRNTWNIPVMTATTNAAALERDNAKRAEIYLELQQEHQRISPFVIMFQAVERAALRKNINGFVIGRTFDGNDLSRVVKD